MDDRSLKQLTAQACRNNKRDGITGMLIYTPDFFLQLLEGNNFQVNALYRRLLLDSRHYNMQLLSYRDTEQRLFSSWHMALLAPPASSQLLPSRPYEVNESLGLSLLNKGRDMLRQR